LDLNEERFLDEPVDNQERVGRIDAVRKKARKFPLPKSHELGDILGVHEVSRELHDMTPACSGGSEGCLDVLEHLGALGIEIILADEVPGPIGREHAGDEKVLIGLDPCYVGVLSQGLSQGVGVINRELGHGVILLYYLKLTSGFDADPAI
jgi:hypothetical protein